MSNLQTSDSLLFFALILVLAILGRALREPYQLEITRTRLVAPSSEPTLPKSTLRVVLLTDLHAEWLRISPKRLKDELLALDFDCLLFGGDLTGRYNPPQKAGPWLLVLKEILSTLHKPAYAVVGNHDSKISLDLLKSAGFEILRNDSILLNAQDGFSWQVIGLDILKKGTPDFWQAVSKNNVPDTPVNRRIVFAHNPDTLWQIPPQGARFFLAGHFHGGQIYLPFHLEFFLLRREKIGRMGYYEGQFTIDHLICYISRGLGSVLFPLRLGSKPEITYLEIEG